MKFICPACKKVFKRDMRLKINKLMLTKRGYKSSCGITGQSHYCKLIVN